MSWRFRKTFKVLPGVKLNLTRHGLSATLGAAPFSISVGPRGVYRNVHIPGTGIWDRQRIGGPSSQRSGTQPPIADAGGPTIPSLPPSIPVSPSPATEIHSASTELLTSESLEHLRRLLTDAYNEREQLAKEILSATHESNTAARRYQQWERGSLMKRLLKQSFATRRESADTALAKLEELQEQLRLTAIAAQISLDREQAEPYYRMRDSFAALSECQKLWNVLTEKAIDRIAERSTVNTAITRNPVSFLLDSCDLIQWEQTVPHLQNHTGGDMYIYPGFILYRASKQGFALIDFRVVTLKFVPMHFTEAGPVPSDTQIIGKAWAKSNKDGSPDRRFQGNHQIPVVYYGSLLFSSPDGLDVRYLLSNAKVAERFAKAWAAFGMSFRSQEHHDSEGEKVAHQLFEGAAHFRTVSDQYSVAFGRFGAANDKFMKSISSSGTLAREDFRAYMATAVEFIASAKRLMEVPDLLQFRAAKITFQRAIESFEAVRLQFENSAAVGQLDSETLTGYVKALTVFFKAITQFKDEIVNAITEWRKLQQVAE
jgi:hypothetical protein